MIEQLLADDITYMFGNPGTVEQGFLDTIRQYPQFNYIATLQESIAVGIADGYARATRKPAVVQLHSGVGLGNGIGMMYQAKRGHAPLVVINGDAGIRYDSMDAQMAADVVSMAKPVTKWATRVVDSHSLLRVLRRTIKIVATPPMGPVFVCLPMDVLDDVNDEAVVPTSFPITRVAPEPSDVANAAALLAPAERPMIIMGDGVAFSGAQAELARLAELIGAEVWGADSSEVNMSASHPLFKGLLGHMFGEHSRAITAQADAILICGTYVFPEVFPALAGVFAPGAPVIHIDLDAYEIAKNFPVDLGLVSDPKMTLARLADALEATMSTEQRQAAHTRMAHLGAAKEQELVSQRTTDSALRSNVPLYPSRFMEELAAQLPRDAIVFDEALTCSPEVVRYLSPDVPGRYFLTRGGSLGVGLPGALGVKLANPEKPVVGFSGDGGSMYTIQALWTAAHHGIDAKFVIFNNQSYKLLKVNLMQYWRERQIEDHEFPACFDLANPVIRFDDLARSMGVAAARVETPQQIAPAIQQALVHDGPFLIDLIVTNDVPGHHTSIKCGQ
jgi:benzoylformate decarboxylase